MEKKPALTIVLPCFNPVKGWAENVITTVGVINTKLKIKADLIIVIDGATENCEPEIIKDIKNSLSRAKIIEYSKNMGKGFALRKGVETVENFPIIYTDIDFPYTNESFESIYRALLEGNDTVLGRRDTSYYEKIPWVRKVISKSLRAVLKYVLKLPTDDTQCGIKGFNEKGAKVFLETEINRFLFDLEFVKLISKRNLKNQNVPVELKPNIVFSKVNFKILAKESVNFMKVLFRR